MVRMHRLVGMAAIGLALTGCVSQEKYNAMKMERDRLIESANSANDRASAAEAQATAYRNQFGDINGMISGKDALIANLTAQNNELTRQYDDAMRRLQDALGRTGATALPEPLSNELAGWAAQNPDLIEFDPAKGVVKFKSDVTFAVGDAQLTPKAKEVLNRFAQILNSAAAAQYELQIAGHTDNQKVTNPNTKRAGHHDNWYLSAHRAISVANELMGQRVAPNRIGVVGYAEQRPVAANVSRDGMAANRRVEVMILPTTVKGQVVQSATGTPGAGQPTAAPVDNRPALNK